MRTNTKSEVVQRIAEARPALTAFGIIGVGVLGPFVRATQSGTSDIDRLVEFAPERQTSDNFMEACFFLEPLLGRRVEVVTSESLSPHTGPHILHEVERAPFAA